MAKVNKTSNTKLEADCHIRFIAHCKQGGSIPEFCLEEDIDRKTFDRWCDTYPHMKEAKIKGKLLAEGWWLALARKHVTYTKHSKKIDSNLYKHIVGGRFGHTADKDAHERLDKIEQQMQKSSMSQMTNSAIAEEADCEPEEK